MSDRRPTACPQSLALWRRFFAMQRVEDALCALDDRARAAVIVVAGGRGITPGSGEARRIRDANLRQVRQSHFGELSDREAAEKICSIAARLRVDRPVYRSPEAEIHRGLCVCGGRFPGVEAVRKIVRG